MAGGKAWGEWNFFLLVSPSLILSFSLLDAAAMKKQAYFNRTAYLPCHPTKAQNMSLSELIVFWQDQKKSVLYEHYFGREKLDNVNAKYLNRTSFDGENWTLGLHNVQIKDMGLYDCFIQKKTPKGLVIVQQTYTELSVVGMCLYCVQMVGLLAETGDLMGHEGRREPFLGSPS